MGKAGVGLRKGKHFSELLTIHKGTLTIYRESSIGSLIIILTRQPPLAGEVINALVVHVVHCHVFQVPRVACGENRNNKYTMCSNHTFGMNSKTWKG